jgi:uncharacterized membrane protein
MLYFFNLVNVNFQKQIDAATKGKVNPILMPSALWWFRWGAAVTLLTGFLYFGIIVGTEKLGGRPMLYFLVGWILAFLLIAWLLRMAVAGGPLKDGRVFGIVVLILVFLVAYFVGDLSRQAGSSNRVISIAIGGGLGLVMFMNVWMIIWPLQKKIIAATRATAETGAAAPADLPKWARRAFLASRTNAWLSIPMLFFMGAASHFPIFGTLVVGT